MPYSVKSLAYVTDYETHLFALIKRCTSQVKSSQVKSSQVKSKEIYSGTNIQTVDGPHHYEANYIMRNVGYSIFITTYTQNTHMHCSKTNILYNPFLIVNLKCSLKAVDYLRNSYVLVNEL